MNAKISIFKHKKVDKNTTTLGQINEAEFIRAVCTFELADYKPEISKYTYGRPTRCAQKRLTAGKMVNRELRQLINMANLTRAPTRYLLPSALCQEVDGDSSQALVVSYLHFALSFINKPPQ